MEAVEYLRALRRRWTLLVPFIVLAMGVAWLTYSTPRELKENRTYTATTTMWSTGTSSISVGSSRATPGLQTLAEFVTVGEVPTRVAEEVGRPDDAGALVGKVEAEADDKTGLLKITATSSDRAEATLLANTFAEQLITMMEEDAVEGAEADADEIRQQIATLEKEIDSLEGRIAASPENASVLEAQRDARLGSYSVLTDQVEQLESGAIASIGLEIVERGVGAPASTGGLQAPRSLPARLALAAILGLLLGVAAVLVMEHLDMRIKDKGEAEEQFDLPVLAEIPVIPRKRRESLAVHEDHGREPIGDSFRFLTAALSLSSAVRPSELQSKNGEQPKKSLPSGISDDPPQVILVTSSSPSEGKTTVVANLAAAFAELGQRVVVFSCDFQRPAVHEFFGLDNDRGLGDALDSRHANSTLNGSTLNGYVKDSGVTNVRVLPSGPFVHNPRELLTSKKMHGALTEARADADIVLIDTAPLLAAGEATLLFPEVDGVLIVSRAGRTTPDAAQRARDVLKRLDAPMLGVVLNAAEGSGVPYYYYPLRERRRGLSRLTNR